MFSAVLFLFLQVANADLRYSFDSYLSAQKNEVINSSINPYNKVLVLPSEELNLDLRGELKWRTAKSQTLLRPRWVGQVRQSKDQLSDEVIQKEKSNFNLTDAFWEYNWNSVLTTTIGLQVFQWGPAEFLNASNPFFHFNSQQKSLFFKEKGQVLWRSNVSLNKENNIVVIFLPVSNNESEWIEEDQFQSKALIKYEKSWSGTLNSVGIIAGSEEKKNLFLGEYFNFSFYEGASLYADIKHSQKKINYEPVFNGLSYDMLYINEVSQSWTNLVVVGLRWESSFDYRIEYIYNSAGFNSTKLKNAIESASNQISLNYLQNLKRFFRPGLELLGQNYIYSSFRIADPFGSKDLNFYIRDLFSLQDQSNQLQFELDKSFLNSWTAYANQTLSYGDQDSEFRLTNAWSFLLGLKYSL